MLLRPSGPMSTTVYTDGACVINPGPGGWAWAAPELGYASGAQAATTNQRMELSAVLEAVHANPGELRIVSDAKYVLDCFGQAWHEQWQRTRWKTSAGKPVTNPDLWQPLLAAYHTREARIEFEWVKGHSNDPTNDIVDRLATEAARTQTGRAGAWPPTDLDEPDRPRADPTHHQLAHIPGWRLIALGLRPPALGGYNPTNPIAADVRRKITERLTGLRTIHPDVHLLTGLALGAQQLAAEAAILADVPHTAVLAHPHPEAVGPHQPSTATSKLLTGAAGHLTLSDRQPRSKQEAALAASSRDRALIAAAHGALIVSDGKNRDLDENITALNHRLPDNTWIIEPS